ncbi:Unknown protein, partial [Striga hermonthica]
HARHGTWLLGGLLLVKCVNAGRCTSRWVLSWLSRCWLSVSWWSLALLRLWAIWAVCDPMTGPAATIANVLPSQALSPVDALTSSANSWELRDRWCCLSWGSWSTVPPIVATSPLPLVP